MNCAPFDVKNLYFENLTETNLSFEELKIAEEDWRNKKKEEGDFFDINPENTCASLLHVWTKEYIENQYGITENELSQVDIWKYKAVTSFTENDYESSRVFAEQAYSLNPNDIEMSFFLLKILLIKLENVSLHKLQTNFDRAQQIFKEVRAKRNSGIFNFEEKHKKTLVKLSAENYLLIEYINNLSTEIDDQWLL